MTGAPPNTRFSRALGVLPACELFLNATNQGCSAIGGASSNPLRYGADYCGDLICAPLCVRRTMLRTFSVIETRPVIVSAELRPKYSAFDDFVDCRRAVPTTMPASSITLVTDMLTPWGGVYHSKQRPLSRFPRLVSFRPSPRGRNIDTAAIMRFCTSMIGLWPSSGLLLLVPSRTKRSNGSSDA